MTTNYMESYQIAIRQPYDFKTVLAFLQRHAAFGIEEVSETKYTRYLSENSKFEVERKEQSHLQVKIFSFNSHEAILNKIKRLFDTEHNPKSLPITTGVRVVGSYEPFETSVSIILGQLISIKQATNRLEKLIKLYGQKLNEQVYSFPKPEDLINQEIEEIGIPETKAQAIRALAEIISTRELVFSEIADIIASERKLLSIKGIGPWTSQLILMRCLGYKDAFPKTDLFIRRAISDGLVDEHLWRNKRSYLTHYLWSEATK